MPCYYPITAYKNDEGGPLIFNPHEGERYGREIRIPCNGCIGCRLDYSRHWGVRMYHESKMHDDAIFTTLTYRDADLPCDLNVSKKELYNFNQRLRRFLAPLKIRYYQCAEYGEKFKRPHYHQIMYGWLPGDLKKFRKHNGRWIYMSDTLNDIWGKGYVYIGLDMEVESMMYVARYVMKKQKGKALKENPKHHIVEDTGEWVKTQNEFCSMSGKPGIAFEFLENHLGDIYPKDYVTINGRKFNPPKYYDDYLKTIDPQLLEDLKADRIASMPCYDQDRLDVSRIIKQSQISTLTRGLEL